MRIKFFVLLFLILPTQAFADELHLVVNGKAYHFDRSQDWNENNYGLGFEYDFAPKGNWIPLITGSTFKDSHNQTSSYLGGGAKYRFPLSKDPKGMHIDVGAIGFLMKRKDTNDNRPFFGALPFMSVGNDFVALNVTYIPKVSPKFANLLFFQAMIRIAEF